MNSLIIIPSECVEPTRAELFNERAKYAFETQGIRESQEVRVAILGGLKGFGTVSEASPQKVSLTLRDLHSGMPLKNVDLIVGLSRPQTVKKVIQAATILGVRSLHFVRSVQGEKSYLQSSALSEEQIFYEVLKGLEQVWESLPPEITIHRTFSYFFEKHLPHLITGGLTDSKPARCLIAHPGGDALSAVQWSASPAKSTVLAIGPERGWSQTEIERFSSQGFKIVGLGERVMRVELAVVFLLGQLEALRLTNPKYGI